MSKAVNSKDIRLTKYAKEDIIAAIEGRDFEKQRDISNYFYDVGGVYRNIITYYANLYLYKYLVIPDYTNGNESTITAKLVEVLRRLKNFNLSLFLNDLTVSVLRDGIYYGLVVDNGTTLTTQKLPYKYCRTRFNINNISLVEFNLDYFDKEFGSENKNAGKLSREQILMVFPSSVADLYEQYKSGSIDKWIVLEPIEAFAFSFLDNGAPPFAFLTLEILRWEKYKNMEEARTEQELEKLLIQQIKILNDGELTFDIDEAKALHSETSRMLSDTAVDVLTTYADVEVVSMQDNKNVAQSSLENMESTMFTDAGTSKNLFASTGNVSLETTVKKDTAMMKLLMDKYAHYFSYYINNQLAPMKSTNYSLTIIPVTIFNEKEKVEEYLKMAQFGYSKLIGSLAQGIDQFDFINLLKYENEVLNLSEIMTPLQSSHTGDTATGGEEGQGKTPLPNAKKTDKTMKNVEGEK